MPGLSRQFSAPAFSENAQEPFHRWANWIAGFSAALVRDCIHQYGGRERALVLDPFAGVGTSLVEGVMAGHEAVGFEINPFAALVARSKLAALDMDPRAIRPLAAEFTEWMTRAGNDGREPESTPPPRFRSRIPFFSPSILRQVLFALDFLKGVEDVTSVMLLKVALGSTMVSFSNYTYEPSLGTRPGARKPLIEHADVASVVGTKLRDMAQDLAALRAVPQSEWGTGVLHSESFFECIERARLAPASVKLVITSPPYPNNYHYVRNTRPQLFWLDLVQSTQELKHLETASYGKFWQTVRNGPQVDLDFDLPTAASLVEHIRGRRVEKGPYGGPGWANYVACYLNDSWRFVALLKRLLTGDGVAVIIVGNHIIQGVNVEVDKILAEMGREQGLTSVIHLLRSKRVGDSITNSSVRRGTAKVSIYEAAVEMRKI